MYGLQWNIQFNASKTQCVTLVTLIQIPALAH